MTIDPDKTYRTRDGRAVRIYATDGAKPTPIHGAVLCHMESDTGKHRGRWYQHAWKADGRNAEVDGWCVGANDKGPHSWLDLIEVTLADELRDQIPWSALRPEIQWVGYDGRSKFWMGYQINPVNAYGEWVPPLNVPYWTLDVLNMPEIDESRWRETLCERPEGR